MGELTARNFGLLIAYVLPGFVGLWGLGYLSEPVRTWLSGAGPAGPLRRVRRRFHPRSEAYG